MSQLPSCQVCGCTSYTKVSGYFVCSNCDTQSQEIEEQLFEYNETQGRINDEEREEIITKSAITDRELTSWEWFNFILKGFVQEFIELGASPQLRVVAFQLWASYLQKANVAFFSKQTDRLPFLPLGFKTSDAKILYGIPNLRKTLFKDVMYRKKSNMRANIGGTEEISDKEDSSSTSSGNRSILSLRSLRHKQRKLALSELSESMIGNETLTQNDSLHTLGSEKHSKSRKRMKVSFKKSTQALLKDLLDTVKTTKKLSDTEKMHRVRNLVVRRMYDSKRNGIIEGNMAITKATLISVIRTALLLMGDDILLGDILRWILEGRISVNQPEKFIPRTKKTREGRAEVAQCNRNGYEIDIKNFTQVLNIRTVPSPNLYKLLERYCEDLCLPNEFSVYVQGIMNFFQPKMVYSDHDFRIFPNFECRVLAYILFSFKLLFSLDGLTERKQSAFADHINKNRSVNTGVPLLFSWNTWVQYIECRKAILSRYDPVMNMHAYKGQIDNSGVFEKHWNKVKPTYSVNSDVINPIFISTTEQVLEKIIGEEEQPNIEFPSSLTPHVSNLNYLFFNHPQLIPDSSRIILEDNFKYHSMLFLINQEWCTLIANACNVEVEFVDGVAEVDMEAFEVAKSALPVVSKTTVIPAYVATPVDVVDDPPRTTKGKTKYDRCKKFHFDFKTFPEPQQPSVKKMFKIYNPSKEYWFFHESHRGISNEHFNELAETNFSDSFFWLLKELAYMVRSDLKDLYLELIVIESVLYSLFVEGQYENQCTVNLFPNEW